MINQDLFDGKYQIVKKIGQGGMGEVYLAKNIKLDTLWAIKKISKSSKDKLDFLAEPNIMKKLNHPAIVRIFDIVEDEENIYIVEDYVEGVSLEEQLNKFRKFDEKLVINWAKQICDALSYLHTLKPNAIVYRDMKPSNLMVEKDGKIKIIDFGIAREYKTDSDSDTTYIGTKGYAAPEQYGTAQTDSRTDIYSLGVTLYHLATGKSPNDPPYEIRPIREFNPNLSKGLEYIIGKCTMQDPNKRYQSIAKLLDDLTNIQRFNKEYKRQVRINNLKVLLFIGSLALFSAITRAGFLQLAQEKLDAYNSTISAGISLLGNKQYDKAVAAFAEASSKMPDKLDAYRETAQVYLNMGDYDKCIEYIEKEVYITQPSAAKDEDILYVLGTAYFNNKNYEMASAKFSEASKINPNAVQYTRDLAVTLARMGSLDEASELLKDLKQKGTVEEVTWYVSGEIFAAQKRFNEAFESFEKSLNLAKDENLKEKAIISIAEIYKVNKSEIGPEAIDREIAILEKGNSILKEKNNLIITEMLGEAYYQKALAGRNQKEEYYKKSASAFQLLLASGYQRPYIYRNIAILYQQMNDFSKSEETLMKMKSLYPQDYTCYMQLALLYADIESKKDNSSRNYQKTYENYELAIKYSTDGNKNPALQQLTSLISDLKEKNWID